MERKLSQEMLYARKEIQEKNVHLSLNIFLIWLILQTEKVGQDEVKWKKSEMEILERRMR